MRSENASSQGLSKEMQNGHTRASEVLFRMLTKKGSDIDYVTSDKCTVGS